jgi:hypothetical protein
LTVSVQVERVIVGGPSGVAGRGGSGNEWQSIRPLEVVGIPSTAVRPPTSSGAAPW